MNLLKKTILLLLRMSCLGYLCVFYSELLFWGHHTKVSPLGEESFAVLVVYSCLYLIAGGAMHRYGANSWHKIFLAGALYGWAAEGAVVHTMYDSFPLNISNTGLSWHAPITVLFGLSYLPEQIRKASKTQLLRLSIYFGLYWGLWSIFWWYEEKKITALPDFAIYILESFVPLLASYAILLLQPRPLHLQVPTWLYFTLLSISLALVIAFALPTGNWSALITYLSCTGITLYALEKNRAREKKLAAHHSYAETKEQTLENPKENFTNRTQTFVLSRILLLPLTPATCLLIYALFWAAHLVLPTGWLFYIIEMPGGFILWIASLYACFRSSGSKKANNNSKPARS